MTILNQFESLTPEEITIIDIILSRSVVVGEARVLELTKYYNSFIGFDTSALFSPEWLQNQLEELENYKKKIAKLKEASLKIKPLKQLVNNE